MPLYEYECEACGRRFELIRKFSDPPVEACELCNKGPVTRLQSAPAIQFKGSGFYITDYARQGADTGKSEASASEKSKGSKSDVSTDGGGAPQTKDSGSKTETVAASAAPPTKVVSPSPSTSGTTAKD